MSSIAPGPGFAPGRETELKFQVPPARRAAVERAVGTVTAEQHTLRARYFDTADGRLAAAGLAWRLRQQGDRWRQTLKARGDGVWQRLEHEVLLPADAGDPPPIDPARHDGTELGRQLRRALAGAGPLELRHASEIVRLTRVLRSAGGRVEVALDVGTLEVGPRRSELVELEFEWLGGAAGTSSAAMLALAARWVDRFGLWLDPATKAARAGWLADGLAAPPVVLAVPTPVAADLSLAKARAVMIGATLAHALPNAAALAGGDGTAGHVHQLRVALRRLRGVLHAFGPPDAARDAALRALFAALGAARDADVGRATLASARAAATAAGVIVPPPPKTAAPAGETGALPALLAAPASTRLWLDLLRLTIEAPAAPDPAAAARAVDAAEPPIDPAHTWAAVAGPLLARWRRRARRDARAWPTLDTAGRHRLRRRLKRVRYLLEFSTLLWSAKALRQDLRALEALQERLGEWHDAVLAQATLAPVVSADPAAAFVAGWLARETVAIERRCAKAAARWAGVKPPALRTSVAARLRQHRRTPR
ncbi:MAG: CHAD domain-containing protein [Rubrivivax sp.]